MKYAFASEGWVSFMHGMIVDRIASLGEEGKTIAYSFCEVFHNPPAEISGGRDRVAWHYRLKDGVVTVEPTEIADADVTISGDYAAILPLARYDTQGDPARAAELAGMAAALTKAGKLQVSGNRAARNPHLADFHDLIARVTA